MQFNRTGVSEAIILVKAAPQVGRKHGETVCIAALDRYQNWLRLYPVSFRHLEDAQKFRRWDIVRFQWRLPKSTEDARIESRRVDQQSIEIVSKIPQGERVAFLAGSVVYSLKKERSAGRSLALLRPEILDFFYRPVSSDEMTARFRKFTEIRSQLDLFGSSQLVPYKPCPYEFKYRYRDNDGVHIGTCQDWEIEATFFNWQRQYGEQKALELMVQKFGEEYPRKGMALAMGTHSLYPDVWLVNGVIRLDDIAQPSLF